MEPAAEAVPPAAPVGIPDPETQVLLPPPAEATATDEANAPGPSPAPDAAEQQLELAVGAEPPAPLLRVVPPHGGAPRTRPAREATRARASVPAWADVLLGTSARSVAPDDDEGPHQDEPQDAAQDRAQPDEPPRG